MPRTARHARHDTTRHDDTTLSLSFATVFVRPSTAFTHWLDGFPHSLMPASSAGVSEAKSSQAALDFLAQDDFAHGFPLQLLKKRTEESLRRLVGSASYALSMMQRQSEEPRA